MDVETLRVYDNGKSQTLYLDPVDTPSGSLQKLALKLRQCMPGCVSENWDAHIGIAHEHSKAEVEKLRRKYQEQWTPISFQVDHVYVFHRRSEVDDFKPVRAVPLGSNLRQPPPTSHKLQST